MLLLLVCSKKAPTTANVTSVATMSVATLKNAEGLHVLVEKAVTLHVVTRTVCNAGIRCVRRWVVRRWVLGDVVLGDGKKPQFKFFNVLNNFFFLYRLSFSVPAGLTLKDFAPSIVTL